jgi:5-dehydro-4-deoxyglucarate dehydratase
LAICPALDAAVPTFLQENLLMTALAPDRFKQSLVEGLLAFPLTDFDAEDRFNESAFSDRIQWMDRNGAAALFVAGGAGEFFSLDMEEYRAVLRTAVASGCRKPVVAAAGYGTRMARSFAIESEKLGADGLLLLPPYLTGGSQQGLFEHIRSVCDSTGLGVIIYNRANCSLKSETLMRLLDVCPNLIGFKDGIGDIEEMIKITAQVGDRAIVINGMPTAEIYARAYAGMGIRTYTSAIYNFVPKSAMAFHRAVLAGDSETIHAFTRDFLAPYGKIRGRQPGYAVSIVKAGVDVVGRSAGPVRPPLSPLTKQEQAELAALIEALGQQD